MGGTTSKSSVDLIQESVISISSSVSQQCAVNSTQDQDVTATQWSWFGSNSATVSQTTDIDFVCATKSNKQNDLQNQISSLIANTSDANGVALFSAFGKTKAEAEAKIKAILKTSLTMENIQSTYITIKNEQKGMFNQVAFFGSNTVDVTQGTAVFARAVNDIVESTGIYQTLKSHVDNSSSAKEDNPLQFLADIFTGAATTAMYIVIGIVLVIIALGLGIIFAGKSVVGGDESSLSTDESAYTDNIDPELVVESF